MAWHSGCSVGQSTCVFEHHCRRRASKREQTLALTAWFFKSQRACSRRLVSWKEQLFLGSSDIYACTTSTFHIINGLFILCCMRLSKQSQRCSSIFHHIPHPAG